MNGACHPFGNQSGLISTDWGTKSGGERRYWRSKAYYVFRQITNATPAGAQVVKMESGAHAGLEDLALKAGNRQIIHLRNSAVDFLN